MEKARFTAWFTEEEMKGIRTLARDNGTSMNLIVRIAVQHAIQKGLQLVKGTDVEDDS